MGKRKRKPDAVGKAWNAALDKGRPQRPRMLVWDADLIVYQAIWQHMRETRVDDDQWTWTVDLGELKRDLGGRVAETETLLWADRSVFCIGSRSNWRQMVLPSYKGNRGTKKPLGWWRVMDWLAKACGETVQVATLEADDVAGIIHTAGDNVVRFADGVEIDRRGWETVTVSEDKDFQCLPGLWFNPRHPEGGPRFISFQQAQWWHGVQTLTGDATDNYSGCPGVGPVKAKKVLPIPDSGLNDQAYQAAVWAAVLKEFAEKGLDNREALTQATVAYLLRFGNWDAEAGEVVLWQPR